MVETTETQVEAGCKAFYEAGAMLTNWGRLVDASPDIAENYRVGMRAALEAAQAATPVVDVEKLTTGLAEMLYDDQTGTRGMFATSTYRNAWVKRVGAVVETCLNGGAK